MTIEKQLEYKFILSLDGNGASWGRINWGLFSNSIVLKYRSHMKLWFYDLLVDNKHYVEVDESSLKSVIRKLKVDTLAASNILQHARTFASENLDPWALAMYWCLLLNQFTLQHG
jgi:hypothetical protein